ncbi:MAG: hypothetical protein IKL55_02025 [Clostridia bacterium]|nr:hypothetical protein [Clostridia bacterium]
MKRNNYWFLIVTILLIILLVISLNKFDGEIKKTNVLDFYSNLLVVVITVALGIINYQQTKHIQEEGSKENKHLREQNEKANKTNEKLVSIIERNTELEEQKNMPCLSICSEEIETIGNNVKLKFKNIGTTIIKCIDIEDVPEETIKHGIGGKLELSLVNVFERMVKIISNCFKDEVEKTDFLKFFEHNIDMVGINETFYFKATPKHIRNEDGEEIDVIALSMKIENIYGKKYIQTVILLLQESEIDNKRVYFIQSKYIDIQIDK